MLNERTQTSTVSQSADVCPVCHGQYWALLRAPLPEIYQQWRDTEFGLNYRDAVKCPACGGQLIQQADYRRARSYLPDSFKAARMSDFDWSVYHDDVTGIQKAVTDFVENFEAWREAGYGLYLYSTTRGSGKTFLASCVAGELMTKRQLTVKFIPTSALLDADQRDRKGESRIIDELCEADIAILDDLGQKQTGAGYLDDVLFSIVDSRYQAKRLLIVTSNIHPADLPLDSRTIDRLIAMTQEIPLPEQSVRLEKSKAGKILFFKQRGLLK